MVHPILLEVIAPVLTDLRHCAHCEVIFGQTGDPPLGLSA